MIRPEIKNIADNLSKFNYSEPPFADVALNSGNITLFFSHLGKNRYTVDMKIFLNTVELTDGEKSLLLEKFWPVLIEKRNKEKVETTSHLLNNIDFGF